METFKSVLVSLIVIASFTGVIFWAFDTIESGSAHLDNQEKLELENKNKELETEISELKTKLDLVDSNDKQDIQIEETAVLPVEEAKPVEQKPVVATTTNPAVLKYQTLINELQKIYNDKVYMKKGSVGAKVGTIQKFLNIYNKTSNKIDNDYGTSMVAAVSKFQKDQGLPADGAIGPSTVLKMITWLKKQ